MAYAYTRSNTNELINNLQYDTIKEYASKKGLEITNLYMDTCTGTGIGKSLEKLINEIPNHTQLLITDRSRISRNALQCEKAMNKLLEKGVEILFTNGR